MNGNTTENPDDQASIWISQPLVLLTVLLVVILPVKPTQEQEPCYSPMMFNNSNLTHTSPIKLAELLLVIYVYFIYTKNSHHMNVAVAIKLRSMDVTFRLGLWRFMRYNNMFEICMIPIERKLSVNMTESLDLLFVSINLCKIPSHYTIAYVLWR